MAQMLDLSPSHLSQIINSKRAIPVDRLQLFEKVFEIDSYFSIQLKREIVLERTGIDIGQISLRPITSSETSYELDSSRDLSVLDPWYLVAVMDLLGCSNTQNDYAWMAQRLGLTSPQVEGAVTKLLDLGYLKRLESLELRKTRKQVRVSVKNSKSEIRRFHAQMIKNALQHLLVNQSDKDYQRRLITGITFSANPAKMEEAKSLLEQAIHEASELLMTGDCSEVYQINLQLFPLTRI